MVSSRNTNSHGRKFMSPAAWRAELAVDYGIISLPTMFLVDSQGKVINRNLRTASEVDRQLEKLLAPSRLEWRRKDETESPFNASNRLANLVFPGRFIWPSTWYFKDLTPAVSAAVAGTAQIPMRSCGGSDSAADQSHADGIAPGRPNRLT